MRFQRALIGLAFVGLFAAFQERAIQAVFVLWIAGIVAAVCLVLHRFFGRRGLKVITMSCLVLLGAQTPNAHAGGVADATEITQIMNNVQLVMSYVEQVEQTSTQLKQYQTMLQNLQQMTPSGQLDQAAVALWRDQNMNQAFMALRSAVVGGQRVSYSLANLDQHFKRQHPGYGGPIDFGVAYRDWSDNTLDAVKNATALMTVHADEFATEEGTIRELQNKSRSAQGQMAALQAGNQVGIATVGQLQKLRQLQMAQMQAQNAYIAGQQSKEAKQQADVEQWIENHRGYKAKKGKGLFDEK